MVMAKLLVDVDVVGVVVVVVVVGINHMITDNNVLPVIVKMP
jgi:hypothetical protein